MAVVEVVEAKVTADTSQFDRSMSRVSGSFAGVGAAAKKGMAVAATALATGAAAAAVKGVTAFAGFESGMNEVFTLMPGITDKAMGDMGDDLKNFSKEMGVATGEAIPALYQAISAGVDKDNVFSFLETAQMAAVGGVTDLETAVDGISSVVNAYGEEVVDATQASDLMFTAVKLGKTDFEQLSRSLFQVAPIAASMDVAFSDVTASLATLTAQGVPTSVAATQMKAAISELGKEGTKASDAFEQMTGQSFQEFIANEGDLVGAFTAMKEGADAAGQSVLDSFGSIEAGQAVLALTADGGEAFASALEEMGSSAGATEGAFNTMEDSVSRDFAKLKASLEVLLIDLGGKLAPAIEKVVEFAQELIDAFGKKGLAGVAELLRKKLKPVETWMKRNKPIIAAVATVIGVVLVGAIYSLIASFVALLSPFVLVAAALAAIAAGVVYAYENFETFRNIVDTVIDGVQAAFSWFMEHGVPILKDFAQTVYDVAVDVLTFFQGLYTSLKPVFGFIFGLYKDLFGKLGEAKDKVWTVIQAIFGFFKTLYDKISPYIADIVTLYLSIYTGLYNQKEKVWGVIQSVIGFFTGLKDGIKDELDKIGGFINSMVVTINGIPNRLLNLASRIKDKFVDVGSSILDGIKDGIGAAGSFVADFAKGLGNSIIGWLNFNVIGGINRAIPNSLGLGPFGSINLPDNPLDPIPLMLAEGGIVTRPTLAMIGEGGESEAVIPLSRLDRMMSGGGGGSQTVNLTVNMPSGSNGDDVVRALQDYARRRGSIPVPVGTARY